TSTGRASTPSNATVWARTTMIYLPVNLNLAPPLAVKVYGKVNVRR
ncbi:MAG: hypothetical protein ACI9KS_002337, partial [Sulfitobacter sp.]